MNRIIIFACFLLFSIHGHGQVGNEWIQFSQPYFKIKVAREGIYKLTYERLQAAGFPVSTVDPQKIQVFHRGIEQSIHVAGEQDNVFHTGDFIEFYGRKNDGTLDAKLYKPATFQPHAYYNLYSDTTCYFLTVGTAQGQRMTHYSDDYTALSSAPFHVDEKLLVLTDNYSPGEGYNSEIYSSAFDNGEGFTGAQVSQGQSVNYSFTNVTDGISAGGLPVLEVLLVGRGPMTHQAQIYVGSSYRLLNTVNFSGYNTYKHQQSIDWADIASDGKVPVRVRVTGAAGTDRLSVSYIKLNYPQRTDNRNATEKNFWLPTNAGGRSRLEIFNPAAGLRLFDVTNTENIVRIATVTGTTLNALIPGTTTPRRIYASSVTFTPTISRVSFRQIVPSQHNYIIISHALLRKPAQDYADPVKAYADYRASAAGGGYDTLVLNIQQVYDQFNYGEPSPLAIYNAMAFLSSPKPPLYLFLIGKGLEIGNKYYRNASAASMQYKDLVPTAGYPGSDMFFTVGIGGTTYEPAVPVGRLTAMKPIQVSAYLNKIKEMEALPYDALWRKEILHLSGGIEDGEPEIFRGYLQEFQEVAEDYHLGGHVTAIAKQARDLQVVNIAEEVNKGLGLITFFGHSSPTTLDFDIGFVTNPVLGYNNAGKYPLLLMNGCESGAFFLQSTLFGEDWIFADKKGASGFIAHASYGLEGTLRRYSQIFYEVAYGDSTFIHQGIGDIQKETARRYMIDASNSVTNLAQIQQMVLLGDPSVRLFGARKPDLEINDDNVSVHSITGEDISALDDSLAIKMVVRNFGQANPGIFRVEVVRTLNDNSTLTYEAFYDIPKYSDTLSFVIRKGDENGFGNNSFRITLDADNIISELDKTNNTATLSYFIPLNSTRNLFPTNFAIVNQRDINLSFQTTDLLSAAREFFVELDTIDTFDSPYKERFTVTGEVLARKAIELLSTDSLTYYWRTKLAAPQAGESEAWAQSSFTYIEQGPEGWAQIHFPQYLSNETEGLVTDATLRKLKFQETVTQVEVVTFGSAAGKPRDSVSVKINGAEYNLYAQVNGSFGCRNNTVNLIAFDRHSTAPYPGIYLKWYEILYNYGGRRLICGREPFVINSFTPTELVTGKDDLIKYVNNIAHGDSVILYNIGDAGYAAWPAAAKTKLGELGISAAQINALQAGVPVVIFGRKGQEPGTATILSASGTPANKAKLTVKKTVTGRYNAGTMNSGLIGPAQQWNRLYTMIKDKEITDHQSFDVIGVKFNGEEYGLMTNVFGDQDLSSIDAREYPYVKIVFSAGDDMNLTPTQLKNWIVAYTPAPEGVLLYQGTSDQKALMAGETWREHYRFVNISEKNFSDSLTVQLKIVNKDQYISHEEVLKIAAPLPGDTAAFEVAFDTENFEGMSDVSVFVNPRLLPEQYYDNNVFGMSDHLNVLADQLPPVLDVTVEGRHLLNGDYVSSNPFIVARIIDENRYSLKRDTTGVRIFLTHPCDDGDCNASYISLSGEHVQWFAATDTSDFRVEFQPATLADGQYTLRVEGADQRGNSSGVVPYEITFVVKGETAVAFATPYPNPFQYEINFDFTVTGSLNPDALDVEILDISGKMVQHFTVKNDHRRLHLGQNKFTLDGAGPNGDILPQGVYFYKIAISVNDQKFYQRGKLVMIR